jgi:hypothetical protein
MDLTLREEYDDNNNNNNKCLIFPAIIYVVSTTPNPDEGTLNDVKKGLRENGLDFNQLVKLENKHC